MFTSKRLPFGHTLVELLVVITIIGVLLGLLMAGIQAARESSRGSACRANLRQLATALQLYEAQQACGFPRRVDALGGIDHSWVVHTLPFMDKHAAYDPFKSGANGEELIEGLICPSDPPRSTDGIGWLSYVANCGGVVTETTIERLKANGVFHLKSGPKVSLDYLNNHDGPSYTLLASENIQAGRWTNTSRALVGYVWHAGDVEGSGVADESGDLGDTQDGAGDSSSGDASSPCLLTASKIIDNGDGGYTTDGAWTSSSSAGASGDLDRTAAGSGATATWKFTNLDQGRYQVSVTWQTYSSCATNVAFTVTGGAAPLSVNQQDPPNADAIDDGNAFEHLGEPVEISGGSCTITLDASATNGYAIADAVRIECVGPLTGDDGTDNEDNSLVSVLLINEDKRFNEDKPFAGVGDLQHARPSSYHPGGVNFSFCDGRVRLIKQTIEYHVYRQLMTPFGKGSDALDAADNPDPVLDVSAFGE
jgi:prepilin-type processing-associated H-X9-DG protein